MPRSSNPIRSRVRRSRRFMTERVKTRANMMPTDTMRTTMSTSGASPDSPGSGPGSRRQVRRHCRACLRAPGWRHTPRGLFSVTGRVTSVPALGKDAVMAASGLLRERDLRALTAVIEDGVRDDPGPAMPWAVLHRLHQLIPADALMFEEADLRNRLPVVDQ